MKFMKDDICYTPLNMVTHVGIEGEIVHGICTSTFDITLLNRKQVIYTRNNEYEQYDWYTKSPPMYTINVSPSEETLDLNYPIRKYGIYEFTIPSVDIFALEMYMPSDYTTAVYALLKGIPELIKSNVYELLPGDYIDTMHFDGDVVGIIFLNNDHPSRYFSADTPSTPYARTDIIEDLPMDGVQLRDGDPHESIGGSTPGDIIINSLFLSNPIYFPHNCVMVNQYEPKPRKLANDEMEFLVFQSTHSFRVKPVSYTRRFILSTYKLYKRTQDGYKYDVIPMINSKLSLERLARFFDNNNLYRKSGFAKNGILFNTRCIHLLINLGFNIPPIEKCMVGRMSVEQYYHYTCLARQMGDGIMLDQTTMTIPKYINVGSQMEIEQVVFKDREETIRHRSMYMYLTQLELRDIIKIVNCKCVYRHTCTCTMENISCHTYGVIIPITDILSRYPKE